MPHPSLVPALARLDDLEAHLSETPPLRLHAELGAIIAGLRAVLVLADAAFAARLDTFVRRLEERAKSLN